MTDRLMKAASLLAALACVGVWVGAQGAGPDSIYVNGTIITMDAQSRTVDAVAVAGGRITAVGTQADVRKLAQATTRVIDLQGRTMLPGFIDAHSHFPGSGMAALYTVNLSSPPLGAIGSVSDIVAALRSRAAQTPKGQWIRGGGYDQTLLKEGRHPTRQELDQATKDHPILITHASGHLSVANSAAFELAGITKDTPQPQGGVIQKDPKTGELTGLLEEVGGLVGRLIPEPTSAEIQKAIDWSVEDYASNGVTTVTIAGGGISPALREASAAGRLPMRIVSMIPGMDRPGGRAAATVAPAARVGDDMLSTGLTVKLMDDGSIQGFTGYLAKPYHTPYNNDATYRGYPHESRDEFVARVKKYHRAGYQIATHANGDAAIDDVLFAYREALRERPVSDHRFRIEHAQMTREDQLDTMKELGVSPSFFVSHTYYWGDQHRDIFQGPERGAHISPLASAVRRGIRFSIHLDTPVTPMRPLQAVWSAVNRLTRTNVVLGPDQRISPLQALRAVTIDAAWQAHAEELKGSIEVGKVADFVVLGENPLTVAPTRLKDLPVVETIVGGKTIHRQASNSLK
ncbi:MAG: amidohydrolase [Vicinamibacterales bacterium]